MEGATHKLADFAIRTGFDQVPLESVNRIKQVLLDSIGCALAGHVVDRGRLAAEFAEECGGRPEASVIGGTCTSCDLAAFVNGELVAAVDAEPTGPLTAHVCPYVLPSTLAVAERVRASGKDVVTALALAHEIGGRVASSLAQGRMPKEQPPYYEAPPRFTWAWTLFGGVAGGGKLLGLDAEKMVEPHPRSLEFLAQKAKAGLPPGFRGSAVEITANGQKYTQEILAQKGSADNPMTQEEIEEKFRAYASHSPLAGDRVEEIIGTIGDLEILEDITKLTRLLTC